MQPINDVRESIVKEIRNTHMDDYMKDLTKRFTPQVQRPDFFVQPRRVPFAGTEIEILDAGPHVPKLCGTPDPGAHPSFSGTAPGGGVDSRRG